MIDSHPFYVYSDIMPKENNRLDHDCFRFPAEAMRSCYKNAYANVNTGKWRSRVVRHKACEQLSIFMLTCAHQFRLYWYNSGRNCLTRIKKYTKWLNVFTRQDNAKSRNSKRYKNVSNETINKIRRHTINIVHNVRDENIHTSFIQNCFALFVMYRWLFNKIFEDTFQMAHVCIAICRLLSYRSRDVERKKDNREPGSQHCGISASH